MFSVVCKHYITLSVVIWHCSWSSRCKSDLDSGLRKLLWLRLGCDPFRSQSFFNCRVRCLSVLPFTALPSFPLPLPIPSIGINQSVCSHFCTAHRKEKNNHINTLTSTLIIPSWMSAKYSEDSLTKVIPTEITLPFLTPFFQNFPRPPSTPGMCAEMRTRPCRVKSLGERLSWGWSPSLSDFKSRSFSFSCFFI